MFSTMSVSAKPTLQCCLHIDPQYWVAYMHTPNDGSCSCEPQQWIKYMLDPNDGSYNCIPKQWVNYMLDPNDGSAIRTISVQCRQLRLACSYSILQQLI